MDGFDRLKLVLVGLFLAAIAVGYLIFSQRFASEQRPSPSPRPIQTITSSPAPTPTPLVQISPTPAPAPLTTKGALPKTGVSELPATGAPVNTIAIFSLAAAAAGFFLRKFSR